MKRIITIALSVLICIAFAVPTMAAEPDFSSSTSNEALWTPTARWSSIGAISGGIEPSGSQYYASGNASMMNNDNQLSLSVTVQKYSGGWYNLQTWYGSGRAGASAGGNVSLSKGTHRLKITVTGKTAQGAAIETVTVYTHEYSIY